MRKAPAASCEQQAQDEISEAGKSGALTADEIERFRATVTYAPVGIAHVRPDGHWLWVNDRLCAILGYSREELLAGSFQDITHPDDLDEDLNAVKQTLRGEHEAFTLDKRYVRKDGSFVWCNLTVSLIRDDAEQPRYFISVVQDITRRKRLEDALLQAERAAERRAHELDETMDERTQILHVVAHELKAPLTSLKARNQIALRRLRRGTAVPAKELERMDEDIQRLTRLIDDLNDAARVERGQIEIERQRFELLAVCQHEAEEQALSTGREVTVLAPEPLAVDGDAVRIRQVVGNLLSNALKYSATETPVTLTLTREGGTARVAVRDQGPGIAPQAQARLFERFYRAPGVAVQHGSGVGLGLGLHISRSLVERHGGTMGVESAPGQGSTFFFTLPLATD